MKLFLTLVLVFIAIVNAEEEKNAIPRAGISLKALREHRESFKNGEIQGTSFITDGATAGLKLNSIIADRFDQKTVDAIASYAAAQVKVIASKEDKIRALKSVLSKPFNSEEIEDRETRRNKRMQKLMSKLPEKYQLPADFKFPENFEFPQRKTTENTVSEPIDFSEAFKAIESIQLPEKYQSRK